MSYSFQTPFWCYISLSGLAGVTSVQGGILADYDQNFSRWWDSPDKKFQLPQRTGNYVPLILYAEILFRANALRTQTVCRGVTSIQGGILADYNQINTHVLTWNPAKFSYPKSLHIRAICDCNIPSKLRLDAIYPSAAIQVSRQFRAAYWLITTKTLVVGGTLLTQSFIFLQDREIMYHSLYRWKILFWANALRTLYWLTWCHVSSGRHISWLRPNWYTCPEVKSCQVWLISVSSHLSYKWLSYSFQRPFWCNISVGGNLVSRQFRAAYWLITTKTLVVCGTLLTQSFIFLKDREIMCHSFYMWKSCCEPTPYWPHIGWHGATSVQGSILADYDQIDAHVLKWNPAKFGYPKSLHIRALRDWEIPSKLRFDAICPSTCLQCDLISIY